MTIFTPYNQSPKDPSYLGYSKEYNPIHGDATLGTLFSGIASVTDNAVKGLDELHKITANRELKAGIETETNNDIAAGKELLGGAPDASRTPLEGHTEVFDEGATSTKPPLSLTPPAGSLPLEVDSADRKMAKMTQASKLGKFGDINYYGNMQTIVQGVISKYPGYADYIRDRAVHYLGVDPAKAQRTAIQQSLDQLYGRANTAQEHWIKEMHGDAQYFGGPGSPTFDEALKAVNDPAAQQRIRVYIAEQKGSEHRVKIATQRLELTAKTGQVNEKEAEGVLNLAAGELLSRQMTGFTFGVGMKTSLPPGPNAYSVVQKALQEMTASTGGSDQPDPKRLQALGLAIGQMQEGYSNEYDKMVNEPRFLPDKNGRPTASLASLTKNPQTIAATKELYMSQLKSMNKHVGEGNLGLATTTMTLTKNIKENNTLRLMAQPLIQRIQALEGAIGGQATATVLNNMLTQKGMTEMAQLARDVSSLRTIELLTPGPKEGGMNTSVVRYNQAQAADGGATRTDPPPGYLRGEIDTVKQLVTNPTLTSQQRNEIAAVITHNDTFDFISQFKNKNEQFNAWSKLSDPEIVAARKKEGPYEWEKFRTWNEVTFKRLFNEYIDTVKNANGLTNVKFNPETQQIEYDRLAYGRTFRPGEPVPKGAGGSASSAAVDRLNVGFNTLKNVLSADGQKITPEYIKQLGIDLTPKDNKAGLGAQLVDSMKNFLSTAQTPDIFKPKTLEEAVKDPNGMPVYYQGKVEHIKNTAETPVKNIQDANGNDLMVIKRGNQWFRIVPSSL